MRKHMRFVCEDDFKEVMGQLFMSLEYGEKAKPDDYWNGRYGVMKRIGGLIVPCYEFGINPLHQLRKWTAYEWRYHDVPSVDQVVTLQISDLITKNDFIWFSCGYEYAVTATLKRHLVGRAGRSDAKRPLSVIFLLQATLFLDRFVPELEKLGTIINKDDQHLKTGHSME